MRFFEALVINLVLYVQISHTHTVPPTIIEKFELDEDMSQLNQSSNTFPAVSLKPSESPTIDTKNGTKSSNEDELVFAHVLYRHGERDHTRHIELTNDGKLELYNLGKYFRRRYGEILGKEYSPDKVYILSTDHDRAIMSAQANLAGLYGKWQPIPVHTVPVEMDNILRPQYGDRCPRYGELYNWFVKESPEAEAMNKKYGHLFEYWAKKNGRKVEHIEHVFLIYKKFLDQMRHNQTIPEWAADAMIPMEEISQTVYTLRARPELVRIRSGFLLKGMLKLFRAKQRGKLRPNRVLYMYSAHSSTITTLLHGLGLGFNLTIPVHGFSFCWEMYKTSKDKYYLQLFLRQPDQEYPKARDIPGCGEKCTLEEFSKVYEKLIPDEFEIECGVDEIDEANQTDTPDQTNGPDEQGSSSANAISGNSCIFSIVLCSLWLIREFI